MFIFGPTCGFPPRPEKRESGLPVTPDTHHGWQTPEIASFSGGTKVSPINPKGALASADEIFKRAE